MDLLRASLKCLFYDYPLETAIDFLNTKNNKIQKFLEPFPYLVQAREHNYTLTEMQTLKKMLERVWMADNANGNVMVRPFSLLNRFTSDVLTKNNHQFPIVNFKNYLRWHDLITYIGEDILTCSYLAQADLEPRNDYVWQTQLEHDDIQLNEILSEGLSDVHHHLQASADVFSINWITLMNKLPDLNLVMEDKAEGEKSQEGIEENDILEFPMKDKSFISWKHGKLISFYNLAAVATLVRIMLFRTIKSMSIPEEEWEMLNQILRYGEERSNLKEEIRAIIRTFSQDSTKECYGVKDWDYAIQETENYGDPTSPYILLAGERWLLYNFFSLINKKRENVMNIAPYVYIYCLIKARFRSEFVLTNRMKGFRNFKLYHDSNSKFYKQFPQIEDAAVLYSLRAGLRNPEKDYLETRISCDKEKYIQELWEKHKVQELQPIKDANRVTLVASAYKIFMNCDKKPTDVQRDEGTCRYTKTRNNAKKTAEKIAESIRALSSDFKHPAACLIGMDATGDEANARPEAFATAYRFLKGQNINNLTYHAGEDFYDMLDGLRAIDELLLFLDFSKGNRIGHALALGLSAKLFYTSRHYTILAPRQIMLDNFVWLLKRIPSVYGVQIPETAKNKISYESEKLFLKIFKGEIFNIETYWNSMLLRANDESVNYKDAEPFQYSYYAKANYEINDEKAKKLYHLYLKDYGIRYEGDIPYQFKYDESIIEIVGKVQLAIMKSLHDKGILVECAPTSNTLVGPFCRYDEHPMLKMCNIKENDSNISVSINTDDAGIFFTSLYAEYSLMALALIKKGEKPEDVYNYIKRIRDNGNNQKFSIAHH